MQTGLKRFTEAQENTYRRAYMEISNGKKESHWMWYIFPQIAGLGSSETAKRYAIRDLEEARLYLEHVILGERLIDISKLLLEVKERSAYEIMGSPDDLKLRSCMTLFSCVKAAHPVFQEVLDKYFQGIKDDRTLKILL